MPNVSRSEFSKMQWVISSPEENLYTQSWDEILEHHVACALTSSSHSADLQRSLLHHANCEPASMSSGMAGKRPQENTEDNVSLCTSER